MQGFEMIAQGVGMIAMLFNVFSYQSKSKKQIFAMQLCGGALFAVNFLMLDAIVGGLLNLLATLRAVVFLFKDKLKTDRLPWLFAFIASYLLVYVLNFTLFSKQITLLNLIVELLPVVGMTALSVGFRLERAGDVRRCGIVSSVSWLIYNIFAGSWGAILCETTTLVSIVIGIFRHDRK